MSERIRLESYRADNWFSNLWQNLEDMAGDYAIPDPFSRNQSSFVSYYFGHSRKKFVGGMLDDVLEQYGIVTDDGDEASFSEDSEEMGLVYNFDSVWADLGDYISFTYAEKWLLFAYGVDSLTDLKPLQSESVTDTLTRNTTDTKNYGHTKSTKTAVSQSSTDTETTDEDVYGYNSSTAVPSGKTSVNGSSTVTGSADDNYSDSTEGGSDSTVHTGADTHTVIRTGGKDLYDRLLKRNQYLETHLFEVMAKDLDSVLTLPFYIM